MIHPLKPDIYQHALVVGGTGMLRGVSLHLAEQGYTVSVVGRQISRLQLLREAASELPGRIVPLPFDYREDEQLRVSLLTSIERQGPIILAVCWIHSTAPNALPLIAETLAPSTAVCRLFHVRGSATANPARARSDMPKWLLKYPQLRYRQVILGFMVNNGKSRWLTHEEICAGVISAIVEDSEYRVVGTVESWSLRP